MIPRFLFAALLSLGTGLVHGQQSGNCQNLRADPVLARVEPGGNIVTCGVGVVLFGYEVGIQGSPCPEFNFIYPAHHPCSVPSEGSRCEYVGTLSVEKHKCECSQYTLFGFGISSPNCECESAGTAGHVFDFRTLECGPQVEAREAP